MAKYDVAVLGAGVAGLAAAAFLADAGKRVVIIDAADRPGGVCADEATGGIMVPGAPLLFCNNSLSAIQSLIHQSLDLVPQSYQVALQNCRVTVSLRQDETIEDLRREFPSEIDKIKRFYSEINYMAQREKKNKFIFLLNSRKSARSFIESLKLSHNFKAFLNVQAVFFYGREIQNLSISEISSLFSTPPHAIRGGIMQYSMRLMEKIRENGGDVLMGHSWPPLEFRSHKVTGLHTEEGLIETKAVLLNMPIKTPQQMQTVIATIRQDVVPVGMNDMVLCLPDIVRPHNIVAVYITDAINKSGSAAGIKTMTSIFLETNSHESPESVLKNVVQKMLMPFLNDFLIAAEEKNIYSSYDDLPNELMVKQWKSIAGMDMVQRCRPIKNLFILVDKPYAISRAVQTACKFAKQYI